ncbi:MAG TPA: Xaa-Pro peptidase family protein [Actinomycetota bacterium]|nr:Xaa-Pro peptidase family protein [Actinomycetota bacterium]
MLDPQIDGRALRAERLGRLQTAMRAHGIEACLLFSEPNVRYATGAITMPVWSMSTFTRCAVLAAEGSPILFEHPNSMHRVDGVDVRPMHAWEFYDDAVTHADRFAAEAVAALRELGVGGGPVAVDRLGTPGFLAFQRAGLALIDSSPATQEAREVKTTQEIALFRLNGPRVVDALGEFEAALAPGVTERELFAVYASGVLARGAEYLATNTVCSGPNTNPWRAEATDRVIDAGDLVYIDTDTVGIGGCFFCVSRTFVCGDVEPTPPQRETYDAAFAWVQGMTSLVRPGVTCAELAAAAPTVPEPYRAQRYEVMVHSVGLEEESPSVCHPQDVQSNPDRVIQPGMVLVVETYMGAVGDDHGVKLGDVVLVTDDGAEVLAPHPYARSFAPAGS